jgi:hypothetical protein
MNMAVNPPSEDGQIELEIQRKGLNAPRIRPEQISAILETVEYKTVRLDGTNVTFAAGLLPSGFCVAIAMSGSVSSANFDAEIGRKVAIQNCEKAVASKLWEFEGYCLAKELASQ